MPFIFVLFLCLIFIVLFLALTAYQLTFHRPSSKYEDDYFLKQTKQTLPFFDGMTDQMTQLRAIPYEKVGITSYDKLRLEARYYRGKKGQPMVICFHGYRGTPVRDLHSPALYYLSKGYSLLLVECRGRLGSGGRSITFGVKERKDCLSWAKYWANSHPEDKIILHGISMGAAPVLMSIPLGLPEAVVGIVADCPYTTPTAILKKYTSEMRIPTCIAYPSVWIAAHLYGHFSYGGVSAITGASNSPVPILLIHGEEDHFVPCDMSRQIAAASKKVHFYTFPGAGHGLSFATDPKRYEALLDDFFKEIL
ncbi:MAG: alpha/beta hydrolase [Blautia sp.]|nr:alpha/beta hydrolase [Blautia sp.]